MEPPNAVRPATRVSGDGPKENACLGRQHISSENFASLQHLRVAHLARRFALAPSMARVVAGLAFDGGAR
jgi:hypothetical protein